MNFKDMKKLEQSVSKMCSFAEQIKQRVTTDIQTITDTKAFIEEQNKTLLTLQAQLESSHQTLKNLASLLE